MKYIVLGKWTDQGRKTIPDIEKRVKNARKLIEEKNGSMNLYFTMGEYDFVSIIDMPDEEGVVEILMKLNAMDNFATKTLKAWTDSEFVKMVSKL
ncbi:MAG: GYD domain-containing protein [Methanobacterium sp.]